MHHWTVHEKVDFPKFPPDTWGGVYSTTFDPELRNEVQKLFPCQSFMGFPAGGFSIFHNF